MTINPVDAKRIYCPKLISSQVTGFLQKSDALQEIYMPLLANKGINYDNMSLITSYDGYDYQHPLSSSVFGGATALQHLSFTTLSAVAMDFSRAVNLDHESLIGIIGKLPTTTSTLTLTLGVANLLKLSDDEKAVAIEKGWTLA